jgi:plastocyanin
MRCRLFISAAASVATIAAAGSAFGMPGMMSMPPGGAPPARVSIEFSQYAPAQIAVLTGGTVDWSDTSRQHTVTADDDSYSSPKLFFGDSFSHRYTAPGTYTYHCQIHSFMHGEVDVYDLILDPVAAAAGPGRPYPLRGHSALPPGTPVTITGDTGGGPAPVASTTIADDGTFAATVTPSTTTTYAATAGASSSPPVLLRVTDRAVTITDSRRGGRDLITATVSPASPGATVVLQLHLRERFGWWPERQRRLDSSSRARFSIEIAHPVSARVVLTLSDGATVLALSPSLRIGAKPRAGRLRSLTLR